MLMIGAAMFMTSCGEDIIDVPGTGGGNEDAPQVILVDQAGAISADADVAAGETFTVVVDATSSVAELNTFSVEQDGVALDPSRYTINGTTPGSSINLLFGDDRTAFTYEVTVTAQEEKTFATYAFVVVDDNNEAGSASLSINTDFEVMGGDVPPEVSVGGNASVELDPNSLYSINVSATPANGQLASITVYQNGALITDLSRLEFAGTDFDANPYGLPSQFVDGFVDEKLFIRVQDSGSAVYAVEIADEFGNITAFEKTVTVEIVVTGTPVTLLTGVLLNQAGVAGTGGLDLDTGNGTGSMDAAAEIRDSGIDGGPVATNWLQTISAVNGSTLRTVDTNGLPESFSFAGIETVEQINDIFNFNSVAYSGSVVLVGDLFTVQRADGKAYLLEVTNINNTVADNLDSYTFSIKQ